MAIKPMGRLFDVKKWLFQHRHCGEGACSRWVAKRPRFVSEVYRVSRTTTASQPNGSKLPRHRTPLPQRLRYSLSLTCNCPSQPPPNAAINCTLAINRLCNTVNTLCSLLNAVA